MPGQIWAVAEAASKKEHISAESDATGYAAGIMTWLLAGSVFAVVKLGVSEMPPWTFCCLRALISALVLVPLVAGHVDDMLGLLRRRWLEAGFIGAIGLGLTQGVTFVALSYTSAINVGIIFALAPMATMLLARVVLREPMNGCQGIGLAVAFIGIVLIAVHGSLTILLGLKFSIGDLFAFCAILLFAGYTVLLKRAKFELPTLPLLVILLFAGSASALPFSLWEIAHGEHEHRQDRVSGARLFRRHRRRLHVLPLQLEHYRARRLARRHVDLYPDALCELLRLADPGRADRMVPLRRRQPGDRRHLVRGHAAVQTSAGRRDGRATLKAVMRRPRLGVYAGSL
jgi:drug/metabolite transporter (DMT)-like permease